MIRRLLEKWFGLDPVHCQSCETLRELLSHSEHERSILLNRLLDKDKPEPVVQTEEEPVAIRPQFTPWRVRQQMLEAEDRKAAQLTRDKVKEIEDLEKELGINKEPDRGVSGGVKADVREKVEL